MCGAVEMQERVVEYGESSVVVGCGGGGGEEDHVTDEQYHEAALARDVMVPLEGEADSEEPVIVFSEGERLALPREEFRYNSGRQGLHDPGWFCVRVEAHECGSDPMALVMGSILWNSTIEGVGLWAVGLTSSVVFLHSSHAQGGVDWEPREALNFDTNLASMHTYLGGLGEVEDVGNERFNGAGGAVLRLPMFYLEGIVLFPGQKLPLRVLQQRFKAAVCHAMDPVANDALQTLGVIHVRVSPTGRIHVANYGTTAKICRAKEQGDGSVNVMTKGQQRFRILSVWTQPDGALFAQVQIIEEDTETLGYFSRHMNNAFAPLASSFNNRSGRNLTAAIDSHVASVDEFVEESEDEEQFVRQHEALIRDESEDLIAALTGEEDELDSSSEDDDSVSDESDFERPAVRARANDGTAIGRRMEVMRREPNEASAIGQRLEALRRQAEDVRNCADEERETVPPEEAPNAEVAAPVQEVLARSRDTTIVPVPDPRPQGAPYANACRMWRQDASRWAMRAQFSSLPHWVYRQYDTYDLARRAADMLGQMGDHPRLKEISCPTALSYYIGSNMPIQDHTRQELLEIDSTLERLKREIELLKGMDMLRCNCCGEVIARQSDVFVMSTEGAIGAYVNAHGYVHETLTLSCARNMRIKGAPQTENSWFPGYAWILAKCQGCYLNRREQHMGWRFIAVDPETRPQTFWGIRRTQLIGSSESPPPGDLYWD